MELWQNYDSSAQRWRGNAVPWLSSGRWRPGRIVSYNNEGVSMTSGPHIVVRDHSRPGHIVSDLENPF